MSALAEHKSSGALACTAYDQATKSSTAYDQASKSSTAYDQAAKSSKDESEVGNSRVSVQGLEITASGSQGLPQNPNFSSFCELDEGSEGEGDEVKVELGPLVPLVEELQHDKEDESLTRWKQQLLGSLYLDPVGVRDVEPEVNLTEIRIVCKGHSDIIIPAPFTPNSRGHLFCLKEGSCYSLKLTFVVRHNLVPGLTYINTVWKNDIRVDRTKVMLGTFSPHYEPYIHYLEEETTPSGIFARGAYTAKTKFVDDDKRCHFELDYSFEIKKDW